MKKTKILSVVLASLALSVIFGCSKDDTAPVQSSNTIKMTVNGREITGSNFRTDRRDLFMEFERDNLFLSIQPMTLNKGTRLTIDPSSSLKFSLLFRSTGKIYIADNTQGSGGLYIEKHEASSERVSQTNILTGAETYSTKTTVKMKGSFWFTGISEDKDSVIVENGIFDAISISYVR